MNFRRVLIGCLLPAACSLAIATTHAQRSMFPTYRDVPEDHWAALPISWVSGEGMMTGPAKQMEYFAPGAPVDRAQLATVIFRLDQRLLRRIEELELRVASLEHDITLLEGELRRR